MRKNYLVKQHDITDCAAAVNGILSALVSTVASALLPATASLNKWATTIYILRFSIVLLYNCFLFIFSFKIKFNKK